MELKTGSLRNIALQKDWNVYPEEYFEFSVVSTLDIKDETTGNLQKELQTLYELVLNIHKTHPG